VGNITFLMIFAVFDPSLLTLWINCSLLIIIKYVAEPVCLVPAAHGNSTTGRPYVRTRPSVLRILFGNIYANFSVEPD